MPPFTFKDKQNYVALWLYIFRVMEGRSTGSVFDDFDGALDAYERFVKGKYSDE